MSNFSLRVLLVSFGLAGSLWCFVALTSIYTTHFDVPIRYVLAKSKAIAYPVPLKTTVTITGRGWLILKHFVFASRVECVVNCENFKESSHRITTLELTKGLSLPKSLEAKLGASAEFDIVLSKSISKKIPVQFGGVLTPAKSFGIVREMSFMPDSITISGSRENLDTIGRWYTQPENLSFLSSSVDQIVPLSSSHSALISLSSKAVRLRVDVDQIAEITITDVPIVVTAYPRTSYHRLLGERIQVTIRGPVGVLQSIDPTKLVAEVDYQQLVSDSEGLVRPTVPLPMGVSLVSTVPTQLIHYVDRRSISLAKK